MSLNPVQFGNQVIDQFGRYLLQQFPVADPTLEAELKGCLRHGARGVSLLHKGPFVHLSRPFEPGPSTKELVADPALGLHPHLANIFDFDAVHKHQELALRSILAGKHTVMATGTGSGKTEGFLMPIVDHCLKRRDAAGGKECPGVTAVLVYPMNALVNDQLERLRPLLAGTRVTFGRYTGETPRQGDDAAERIETSRQYTADERNRIKEKGALILPFEECFTQDQIRERRPNLLLINYVMLEYLLLRDKDLDLLRDAPLRFFVFDEVHTYTGALGSEVACLIRRLRQVAGKGPDDIVCIGTSATVTDDRETAIDGKAAIGNFCHRLFGVEQNKVELITEQYQKPKLPTNVYTPPTPSDMLHLLGAILEAARDDQLQDTLDDINPETLRLVEQLCGKKAPRGNRAAERLYRLLVGNGVVLCLADCFNTPRLFDEAVEGIRRLPGRAASSDEEIRAEMLAYLTLGALALQDEEPLLRPKLHYFIQGFQGLRVSFEKDGPILHLDENTPPPGADGTPFPLLLCRACGQHFIRLVMQPEEATADGADGAIQTRVPERFESIRGGKNFVTFTNQLQSEQDDADGTATPRMFCRFCGALHPATHKGPCGLCGVLPEHLVRVLTWEGEMHQCPACGAFGGGRTQVILEARSHDVGDITIIAQSMLAAMPERKLQKLLVFADNRQDAAFQAGWMEERGKRFRMRHLLYQLLHDEAKDTPIRFARMVEKLMEKAQDEGVLPRHAYGDAEEEEIKVRWFLDDEFASMQQRRRNLETLGLARVEYDGLDGGSDPTFFSAWSKRLGIQPAELIALVRLLLDNYRQRGVLSDELLRRQWTNKDKEVSKGLVTTSDWQVPQVLTFAKKKQKSTLHQRMVYSLIATNGRSFAQVLVKKSVDADSDDREEFLKALWDWLIDHELLVPVQIIRRNGKRIEPVPIEGSPHQINAAKVGFREATNRFFCGVCRRAHSASLPSQVCPEYTCKGKVAETGRDEEDYDVVQFTRTAFVPLKSYEHSAQVPQEKRTEVEREFKREDGRINTIVATPTLELGVDIGKLEMVLMRNVPPTPANYAQRAGRAGRKHRIAAVFTYCRGSQHDRYFFADPPAIIAGDIRVPAFSLQNEPLIRKHVRSCVLTALRALVNNEEREVLSQAFPVFVWEWLGRFQEEDDTKRFIHHTKPPDLIQLKKLVQKHLPKILAQVKSIFQATWPEDDRQAVKDELLKKYVENFTDDLTVLVNRMFSEVTAYRQERGKLLALQQQGSELTETEKMKLRQYNAFLSRFLETDREHYALSRLCQDGFFPGYALTRESISAQCIEPFIDLSRPAAVAIRELTPGALIYANKQVFHVRRMAFSKLKVRQEDQPAELARRKLRFDDEKMRVYDQTAAATEGGNREHQRIESFQMTDVELRHDQEIDDTSDARRQIAYTILGALLERHQGGYESKAGEFILRYLRRAEVRLINLGPALNVTQPTPKIGFPVCPVCGETRNPFASQAEIDNFTLSHKKHCHTDILWAAMHVDVESDVVEVGPFQESAEAINFAEGMRLGCRMVLDMGDSEIESFPNVDSDGKAWAVFYDPVPGGSGFLSQMVTYWMEIVEQAVQVLSNCPTGSKCETACYRCMKHFFNQQHHKLLNRFQAIDLLHKAQTDVQHQNDIAAWKPSAAVVAEENTDSPAEWNFITELEKHRFPLPDTQQFRVNLPGGSYTSADYAYSKEKVLVFIDGLSKHLHGDPVRRQKDKLNRKKAAMQGFTVVEIPAEAMNDPSVFAVSLEELNLYLNAERQV
jgi:ATP-dependent helicase YprA (DUF1998 family)